jgi:hypothetical protein
MNSFIMVGEVGERYLRFSNALLRQVGHLGRIENATEFSATVRPI